MRINEERKRGKWHCGVEWRGNANVEGICIEWRGIKVEWSGSGVEVEWKWSGSGGAIVQSTGRRGISISISGCWYPDPDPDMQVQWIRSGGESHRGFRHTGYEGLVIARSQLPGARASYSPGQVCCAAYPCTNPHVGSDLTGAPSTRWL
jgi:hypothetical protein